MTEYDLDVLDTIGTTDYITGELSDTGALSHLGMLSPNLPCQIEVDIPAHMVPPNPDDSDGTLN